MNYNKQQHKRHLEKLESDAEFMHNHFTEAARKQGMTLAEFRVVGKVQLENRHKPLRH